MRATLTKKTIIKHMVKKVLNEHTMKKRQKPIVDIDALQNHLRNNCGLKDQDSIRHIQVKVMRDVNKTIEGAKDENKN